ncbi:MAG: acyl-ACP--UDP-N-acetylglucosamine O-acyltransferase [Phycisphaera sp.]|nr:acyl-ACP--UDP-N-acetylglucosamine O-acyltransferase [Phycisphaera sp.]
MPDIHPSAIIDDACVLAPDVQVGPGCILTGPIKLGPGCRLIAQVYMQGPVAIGQRNTFYPHCTVGLEPQDRKFDPRKQGPGVLIGDDNIFREGVTIHRATGDAHPTTLGSHNYLMVNSHVGHDCVIGNHVTLVNGALLGGHVVIADRANIGGNASVHQFCRVGRLAMLSGTRGITQDLPPFCTVFNSRRVSALNLVGLRRNGHKDNIDNLKLAFNLLYRRELATPNAVERIRKELGHDPACVELADFVATTTRGITPYGSSEEDINDLE